MAVNDPVVGVVDGILGRIARQLGCREQDLRAEYEAELVRLVDERDGLAGAVGIDPVSQARLDAHRQLVDGQIAELREKLA